MEKKNSPLRRMATTVWRIPSQLKAAIVIAVVSAAVAVTVTLRCTSGRGATAAVVTDDKIDITPTQIRSIEQIGQWEFLSINDEELIDTVRHGFFGDDELMRIYYGTLRLGIDLGKTKPGWLKAEGDTVTAVLPPVELLDENFIDEAKTRPFIEKGKWSPNDRADMYDRAYAAMRSRCLNRQNIESARQNAETQFRSLLKSMGFENVKVRFADEKEK